MTVTMHDYIHEQTEGRINSWNASYHSV